MVSDNDTFSGLVNRRAGAAVAAVRTALQLSQQDVADAMTARGFRWHQPTVGRVERGDQRLRADELQALADLFGVGAGDLLAGERTMLTAQVLRISEEGRKAA